MRTHNIFDHIFRFVKANNFASTKHKITFRVFDEYILYGSASNIQWYQYFKNIPNKYSLQKYSSLNSIRNPIIIEQIGKEIFPDEDKVISWTASETLLAVNKQAVHTISWVYRSLLLWLVGILNSNQS